MIFLESIKKRSGIILPHLPDFFKRDLNGRERPERHSSVPSNVAEKDKGKKILLIFS